MWEVEIRENIPNKGKGLFALKEFKKGDVLFEETPLASAQFLWNAVYKYEACDHCMTPLETAEETCKRLTGNPTNDIPLPNCCTVTKEKHTSCPHCQVRYCSEECLSEAWQRYHQVLCMGQSSQDSEHPLARLQEAWRNIHYPPETASIMLIARMIATVKQASDKQSVVSSFSRFCKTTVNDDEHLAHKLLGKEFQVQQEMLRQLLSEALYDDDLQQWFTPEGFRSLLALLGTNGQGIGTSSLSNWVKNAEELEMPEDERDAIDTYIDQLYEDIDKVSGQFINCEGSGLYVLQSSCNHSCAANSEVTFPYNNFKLSVVAQEDIRAGEEVTISYLDCCDQDRSRHSRQKILRENYLFTCTCSKCESQVDDPDMTSEEEEEEEDMEEES